MLNLARNAAFWKSFIGAFYGERDFGHLDKMPPATTEARTCETEFVRMVLQLIKRQLFYFMALFWKFAIISFWYMGSTSL